MTYTSQIKTQFAGISQPLPPTFVDPPHNALGVGPNNIVMVEGSAIEWTDLTGGNGTTTSVYTFFNSLGGTSDNALFDPRVVFDSVTQRFIVSMENLSPGDTTSNVDIAVSNDANPNDGWSFASLNTTVTINNQVTLSDQPVLTVDGTNIYITTPQFNASPPASFQGTEQWVISDAAGNGTSGYPLTVEASPVAPLAEGVMRVAAGTNGTTYYAGAANIGGQTVVTVQGYNVASGIFGTPTSIPLGNSDQGNGASNYTAQQKGTNVLLDAGDGKIQNLAYANGFLYGVSEVSPVGSSAPEIHWFKIDVSNPNSPVLAAQGDISGDAIGAGVAVFDASIAVDAANDVVINFTASGANMFPGDYYVFHGGADPISSFSAPVLYQASDSFLANGDGPTLQRWGINSSAIADPNNPQSFWLSSEYVSNGLWETSVAQVQIHAVPTVTAGATATFTGGGAAVALDGGLTISDPDSGGNLTSATVSVGTGFLAGDTLNFTNQNGISGSYDAVHGVLTLTGTSSVANYQTALDSITYNFSPANDDPTGGGSDTSRTIDWAVNDGVASSNTATSTLDTVHAGPTVTAGATAIFTGGGAAVALDGGLTLSDPDSGGNLTSATVAITGGIFSGDGDVLAAVTGGTNVVASYDSTTETLTLSGTDTLANYQSVLAGVTFASGADPTNSGADPTRTVTWTVDDGSTSNHLSVAATSTVDFSISPTNAALVQESNGVLDYLEFAGPNLIASHLANYGINWNIPAEGDFNNDGHTDLVAQDPASGAIDLLFVNNGALQSSQLEQGTYGKVVGAGDFDGSGRTAIATQDSASGQIDLLWFTGTQLTSSELLTGSYQHVVGTTDVNGDGKTDFVTQSPSGGPLDFLFFNNENLVRSALTPDSFWPVHDVTNSGVSGQSVMLSQDQTSGQLDYLEFDGSSFVGSKLEAGNFSGLTAVQGTQVAAQFFPT
jgi:hypothetical protein